MSFMKVEITEKLYWYKLETDAGTWFVPLGGHGGIVKQAVVDCLDNEDGDTIDGLLQFTEGTKLYGVSLVQGYGVRLSAAGYLDCTDWDFYPNKREAIKAARELAQDD